MSVVALSVPAWFFRFAVAMVSFSLALMVPLLLTVALALRVWVETLRPAIRPVLLSVSPPDASVTSCLLLAMVPSLTMLPSASMKISASLPLRVPLFETSPLTLMRISPLLAPI